MTDAYRLERFERTRMNGGIAPVEVHGLASVYNNWRCRCELCTVAKREQNVEQRNRTQRPDVFPVDTFLPIRAERTDWTSPEWMADAACTEFYGDFWFPEKGETPHAAKRICRSCDVRERCLDFALSMDPPPAGVWGGTVERERRQMRRRSA